MNAKMSPLPTASSPIEATMLVTANGLRLLFDPLVGVKHHGDVFDVTPPRTLQVDRLRADASKIASV